MTFSHAIEDIGGIYHLGIQARRGLRTFGYQSLQGSTTVRTLVNEHLLFTLPPPERIH